MFDLPQDLLEAIERETAKISHGELVSASEKLSDRYRQRTQRQLQPFVISNADRSAYLAARLPATYAAISRVLHELRLKMPDCQLRSLLDLGSGPGTVMWSAVNIFPMLEKITLWEQDDQWISLGKRLSTFSENAAIKNATWHQGNLQNKNAFPSHDIITLSYVIGELAEDTLQILISQIWQAASQTVVIIEPGTPDGYQKILAARRYLIDVGANIVAPCPHALACPMADGDWCHFSQRLERSSLHREIKAVSLGYEDEKYSYIIGSKLPSIPYLGRILRHPQKRSGHTSFTLCTSEGIKQRIISRREKEIYKQSKKLEWGDSL